MLRHPGFLPTSSRRTVGSQADRLRDFIFFEDRWTTDGKRHRTNRMGWRTKSARLPREPSESDQITCGLPRPYRGRHFPRAPEFSRVRLEDRFGDIHSEDEAEKGKNLYGHGEDPDFRSFQPPAFPPEKGNFDCMAGLFFRTFDLVDNIYSAPPEAQSAFLETMA